MIQIRRDDLFGTWAGRDDGQTIELRFDVGAPRCLDIISGDVFLHDADTPTYHHSFRTTHLQLVADTDGLQRLSGAVNVFDPKLPHLSRLDVDIPDTGPIQVHYTFYQLTMAGRRRLATFSFDVSKVSVHLREVELEFDHVEGVVVPEPFDLGSVPDRPDDLQGRQLDYAGAFADAGIRLTVSQFGDPVKIAASGLDGRWTDEELHAAMVANFAHHRDDPQWRLYLLFATQYVDPGVLGIMFDSDDASPRQGSAVFANHPVLAGQGAARDRDYLFTVVHELGHAFNLLHSFQKHIFQEGRRELLARPASPSWMNYPDLFPFGYSLPEGWDGPSQFWPQFSYCFDDLELEHLRHFHALGVVMGGDPFGASGHRTSQPFEPVSDDEEVTFNLWVPPVIEYLQILEGDVQLKNTGDVPVDVANSLRPEAGNVTLLIQRPGSTAPVVHAGVARQCTRGMSTRLAPGEAHYAEIRPSFDRLGWNIDEPGTYLLQAVYAGPDGRRLASPIRSVHVAVPDRRRERLGETLFSRATARYLGLDGSRAPTLRDAQEALEEVAEETPRSAIAEQVKLTELYRDTRPFKTVAREHAPADHRADAALALVSELAPRGTVRPDPTQAHLRIGQQLDAAAQAVVDEPEQFRRIVNTKRTFLNQVSAPKEAHEDLDAFVKTATETG